MIVEPTGAVSEPPPSDHTHYNKTRKSSIINRRSSSDVIFHLPTHIVFEIAKCGGVLE